MVRVVCFCRTETKFIRDIMLVMGVNLVLISKDLLSFVLFPSFLGLEVLFPVSCEFEIMVN